MGVGPSVGVRLLSLPYENPTAARGHARRGVGRVTGGRNTVTSTIGPLRLGSPRVLGATAGQSASRPARVWGRGHYGSPTATGFLRGRLTSTTRTGVPPSLPGRGNFVSTTGATVVSISTRDDRLAGRPSAKTTTAVARDGTAVSDGPPLSTATATSPRGAVS